eukprot:m.77257 g.77257  ORF g.77257 m.77257 type:complete len:407 (+) comp12612_c0_seq3:142-1362(+)
MGKKRTASEADLKPSRRSTREKKAPGVSKTQFAHQWTDLDGISYCDMGGTATTSKFAGFDMDWTIIKTMSGKTFPSYANDWKLWDEDKVPEKLQSLTQDGFKVVIFTNQGGIEKGNTSLETIKLKIEGIQAAVGVPMVACIMYSNDMYRKPRVGAWELIEQKLNGGVQVNRKASIFVGDGAGRVPPHVAKKDFGDSDLKFALNLGVSFQTPEECFLGEKQVYPTNFEFDPRSFGKGAMPIKAKSGQELVLCVGPPGSGKSTLSRTVFSKYTRVNRDTLKTPAKCQEAARKALAAGKSVIVDNQNTTAHDRAPYVAMAKKFGVEVRAIVFDVSKAMCFHMNEYRSIDPDSKEFRDHRVPKVVIHTHFKHRQIPTKDEVARVETVKESDIPLCCNNEKSRKLLTSFVV